MPVLKNEIKCLPSLPPLNKSSTVLHTFNSTILTPVSNNNSGFLRNLLNSSTGKVCTRFIFVPLRSCRKCGRNRMSLQVPHRLDGWDRMGSSFQLLFSFFFLGFHFLKPKCVSWGLASWALLCGLLWICDVCSLYHYKDGFFNSRK